MNARRTMIKVALLVGALLVSAFLAANLLIGNSNREGGISAGTGETLSLARPAFAQGADTTFLD